MIDLAVIYSESFKKHKMDRVHPESPARLDEIIKGVKELQYESKKEIKFYKPQYITEKELVSVHVVDLIRKVQAISEAGGGMITIDTTLNPYTYDIARLAAGATKQAAEIVDKGEAKRSFAIVRPPGHHAESNSAGGFCYFNNIAIAANWLVNDKGYKKVAIIDIDHHFGNGTSHIFYHRKDVFYFSVHAHPMYSYPGSGYPTEIGVSEGKGYNANLALLPGVTSSDWLHSLQFGLDILKQYKPEIVLVSVGFDSLGGDPVGIMNIAPNAFWGAGHLINEFAEEFCNGKIICALEGGYKLDQLKDVSKKFILGLMGEKLVVLNKIMSREMTEQTRSMIVQTKKALKEYWNF
jgi:acetoin utilization deacetylase AcuC-like enzyme